ncbi:DnaD domain-containing protein [Streptococcus uberis]|uniref:DnaD domain-containing protein n=1 Tax=Streptococcus uberis TaxID=1349 RepID=UPI0027DD5A2C|nr:DnaD domain protein [Streptococcus uberis]MCK1234990.1 DnaD domain protein [Streptococcus uberis]
MGNRRMISKTITQTHRFLQMPLEVQALYFHLIQNSDDDGIVEAFPIVRMIGASEDSLKLLQAKAFIKPLNDEMIYFILDFFEQNTVRKDRYTPSIYKDLLIGLPTDNQKSTTGLPNISKGNISKDNISKGSRSKKEKTTTPPPILNQDFYDLYQAFEQETGKPLSPMQIEELKYMLDDYKPDLILEALREAASQGKANFAYIQAILKRWRQDSLMTVELVRNAKAAREKKKQGNINNNEIDPDLGF